MSKPDDQSKRGSTESDQSRKRRARFLALPGLRRRRPKHAPVPAGKPGDRPGLEGIADLDTPPPTGAIGIQCIDYNAERCRTESVEDFDAFLAGDRPEWATVRWINVDGLHPYLVNRFKARFGFHTLAGEDVLHVPQRPKVEAHDNHLFVVVRMIRLLDGHFDAEQVSMFLYKDTLITFQQKRGDVWAPIRSRLEVDGSRIRSRGASYLLYALIDALVDHLFPLLERYSDQLEILEVEVMDNPTQRSIEKIHSVKRELTMLRRIIWPLREVIDALRKDEDGYFADADRDYMRDVYDHTIQVVELTETLREMAGGLTDLYMSSISNRMNEIMKVLTIMASLFIPITFIAGVYGMNFEFIPETKWKGSYAVFWVVCLGVLGGMLYYFKRRGWLGGAGKDDDR